MKLPYIDALSGLAIFLVLIVHTANYGIYDEIDYVPWFKAFTDFDSKGVQLFFIVGSFTFIMSYIYRKKTEGRYVRNFFTRRFFRLAPI